MCMVLSLLCSLSSSLLQSLKYGTKLEEQRKKEGRDKEKGARAGSPFSLSLPFSFFVPPIFLLILIVTKNRKRRACEGAYMVLYGYKYIGRVASTPAPWIVLSGLESRLIGRLRCMDWGWWSYIPYSGLIFGDKTFVVQQLLLRDFVGNIFVVGACTAGKGRQGRFIRG